MTTIIGLAQSEQDLAESSRQSISKLQHQLEARCATILVTIWPRLMRPARQLGAWGTLNDQMCVHKQRAPVKNINCPNKHISAGPIARGASSSCLYHRLHSTCSLHGCPPYGKPIRTREFVALKTVRPPFVLFMLFARAKSRNVISSF